MELTKEIEEKGFYTKNGNLRLNGTTYYVGHCRRCGKKFYGWYRKSKQIFCGHSCAVKDRTPNICPEHLIAANNKKIIKHEYFLEVEGKVCSVCNKWNSLSHFGKSKISFDKLENRCNVCQSQRSLKYYQNNRDQINKYRRSEKYKLWFRKYQSEWLKNRRQTDISFKIKKNTRTRIYKAVKRFNGKATIKYLGCSITDYIKYLEELFQPGMTWDNYGKWEIDHIKPCASFDLSDVIQCNICFNYKNTQPLWAIDNNLKRDKL